jgi:DNA polymerase I
MIIFKKVNDMFTTRHGIHIDLYQFYDINAIKTYAFGNKYKEVNLDAVAFALLGEHKVQITKSISELNYDELVIYNFRDAKLTLNLLTFNSWLPWKLMVLISRISKMSIEDVTRKQVSAWIKNLFFWEHRRRRYLIPNKEDIEKMKGSIKSSAIIKGKRYQGAFVFEPVAGIFFNVVVLDFASLYPTIIKKYNISYETVNELGCKKYIEAPEVGHKICQDREGITPLIVGLLRDYRVKIYKKKAKDKSLDGRLREWYNTVQSAMKVYINASYGVLGADSFELYCPPAAESITAFGRHAIKATMKRAEEHGIVVLYGDTDSMFLWSPPQDRLDNIITWVKNSFGLEIEIDKIYRFVAFTGLKKNYIGVYPDGSIDVKGLLGKKRNTPLFVKETFTQLIDMIREIKTPEEVVETRRRVKEVVKQLYTNPRKQYYDLDELAFHMQLTKSLNAYTKNMPQHVKAALMLRRFGVEIGQGDVISFVKVKGSEGVKPVQLAKLPELDLEKYFEVIETTLGQILKAFSIDSAYLNGTSKLEAFLSH